MSRRIHRSYKLKRPKDPLRLLKKGKPLINKQNTQRNDPCPCFSGKKFKHCCLINNCGI